MRLPVLSPVAALGVAAAVLAGAGHTASAQSPNSYPWCAKVVTRSAATSCYYANRELCMQTISGIGGYCYQNPGYRGPDAGATQSGPRHRHTHPS
jgi:Protein of unknown function (DUF3551)